MSELKFAPRSKVGQWRVETLLTKEPATIAWIDAMPEGSVFWDIGANIGIYSIYAASKGHDVVAVEPNHRLFDELRENIDLNGFSDRVALVRAAVGERAHADAVSPVATLGGIWSLNGELPTHIKIDTDGDDLAVLKGGPHVVRQARSVIVEVDESNDDAPHIRDLMTALGFRRTGRFICPFTPQSPIGMDHFVRR